MRRRCRSRCSSYPIVSRPSRTSMTSCTTTTRSLAWSCKARRIKVTMFPIPWKDDILLYNEATSTLFLESVPNGLDVFEIRPKKFAVVYPGFWQLCDCETTVEFLLRPRRYRLLLKDDATKRTAERPLPPSKRSKHSTGAAVTRAAEIPSSLAQDQKTIIRPTAVDVDMLTSIGLGQNQTLNVVDSATGQLEYSIKCIDRYLKKGDYADVFKAVWKDRSSRPAVVAVKLHKIAAAAEPYDIAAAARRWKRELEAHRHLEHPCIANLLAFDSRLLALVIEHRDSHDLATPYWCFPSGSNARRFRGSLDDACHILADVSSALAYCADQGLVHNDIKAGNILYRAGDPTGSGRKASAVVIDFGLSRNVKTQIDDSGGGSPWYLAPEWLQHKRRGTLADVFSLGVVMLYLLRRIRLPDKERGWNVNAIQQHAPEAMMSMQNWLGLIGRRRDELQGAGESSKETKLQSLVPTQTYRCLGHMAGPKHEHMAALGRRY
ncbi:kinase-like domain-containing protein, partial [Diaporthe sp. PMI_573]